MVELNNKFEVIIIGAGAAGLICAAEATKRKRKTLIIEHNKNFGEKIRISGGGKCNFTNLNIKSENYHSLNPYFCISALKRFSNNDFIKLVEKHNISYHEKTLGQLFCDNSAKDIINMLLTEANSAYLTIKKATKVNQITNIKQKFQIKASDEQYETDSLVIATGGLSIPKIGASDFGYEIAKKFKLNIITTNPALVPFKFSDIQIEDTKILAGISVQDIEVSCNNNIFREDILFTHRGITGPAILQISSYWQQKLSIKLNLLPDINFYEMLINAKIEYYNTDIINYCAKFIPKNLAKYICNSHDISGSLANIKNVKLRQIAENINNWRITPHETEGYKKAEVTKGGIDTDEIDAKKFYCKKNNKLFFIGEILDVTGHLGGYNFQWAWSSGYCAGQYC